MDRINGLEGVQVDDTVARLRAEGGELIGGIVEYEDKYRLCCMRGPGGIIVSLAQGLLKRSPVAPV